MAPQEHVIEPRGWNSRPSRAYFKLQEISRRLEIEYINHSSPHHPPNRWRVDLLIPYVPYLRPLQEAVFAYVSIVTFIAVTEVNQRLSKKLRQLSKYTYSKVAATKAHIVLDPFDISATGIQISSESERAKGKDGSGAAAYHRISHVLSPGKPDQIRDRVFSSHLPCSTIELTTSVIDAKGAHILLLQICYMNLGFRLWPKSQCLPAHNSTRTRTRCKSAFFRFSPILYTRGISS